MGFQVQESYRPGPKVVHRVLLICLQENALTTEQRHMHTQRHWQIAGRERALQ